MSKGTVKFFNEAKGFGFIKDENGQEIFVHATGLIDEIQDFGGNDFNLLKHISPRTNSEFSGGSSE